MTTFHHPPRHLAALWQRRDFRLLVAGEATRLLGTQFYFLALPWLALRLGGGVFAPGLLTVLGAIPRLALMPLGGVLSDRLSARTLLVSATVVRGALLAVLAGLVLGGTATLGLLGAFCIMWGTAEAFFFPARGAIVPTLLPREQIQPGNGLALAAEQGWELLGPTLAGLAIHRLGTANLGLAIAVAALANGGAAALLALITPRAAQLPAREQAPMPNVLASLGQALGYAWRDGALRASLLILLASNGLILSPLWLALPVLAKTRLSDGVAALGLLTSVMGGGALLGAALAGSLPAPSAKALGPLAILALGLSGAGLVALFSATTTLSGALAILVIGVALSYLNTMILTWIQRHTPPTLLGRMMSLATLR